MSLARPFFLAVVFAALAFAFHTTRVEAIDAEANTQCPPGGKIGQTCIDNTNGYRTKGKCAYVYVCKATDVNDGTPPVCAGGSCPVGGPPPSNFNPYPKPVKVASGSPAIPKSGISGIEQGILDTVFGDSNAIDPGVDLEEASAAANARLASLQEYAGAEDLLLYAPESFDEKTSTLFEDLRAQAVTLAPGQKVAVGAQGNASVRLAHAGGGFFGGDLGAPSGGGGGSGTSVEVRAFLDAPQLFARAFANAIDALINILLADFTAAAWAWADAKTDFSLAMHHLGIALKSLFAVLWEMIRSWVVVYAEGSGSENAQCAKGNYRYDYRVQAAPCTTEKCMLNAPCEGEFAKGFCAAEATCNAISIKVCEANTGSCSWTKPELTAIPPAPSAATVPKLEPLPTGDSGLAPFLEKAFQDAEAGAAQQLIDDASRRVDEALKKIQNDSENFSEHFTELRRAQEDLALGQRLLTQDPSLRDYIRGVIAPRMTPGEMLPDGAPAQMRTYEWLNNLGSTFEPYRVAGLGGGIYDAALPPNCVPGTANCASMALPSLGEQFSNAFTRFPEHLRETVGPRSVFGESYVRPVLDNLAKLATVGYCNSWNECLGGDELPPAAPGRTSSELPSLALLPPSTPSVTPIELEESGLGRFARPLDFSPPTVSPFELAPERTALFARPLRFTWTGETALTEADLQRMLAEEPPLFSFSRPLEFFPPTSPLPSVLEPIPAPSLPPSVPAQPAPSVSPPSLPPASAPSVPPTPSAPSPAPSVAGVGGGFLQSAASMLNSIAQALLSMLVQLTGGRASSPPPAPSATLTVTPSSIASGERTRLSWSSTNANACTIYLEDGAVFIRNGPRGAATTSPLTVNTTFRLECTRAEQSATSEATVRIR